MTRMIAFLLLGVLLGCDRWFEQEEEQEQKQGKETVMPSRSVVEQELVRNETVFGKWLISEVKAGEIIHFEIKAIEEGEQFSEVYSKIVKSFWESRKCHELLGIKKISCTPWESNVGECEVRYRDSKGLGERFLDLSMPATWPFEITVGGMPYSLDNDFSVGPTTLKGKLTITEKMVSHDNGLAIEVIEEESPIAYVGFVGFGECEGKDRANFKVEAPTHYYITEPYISVAIEVTITRQRYE